MKYIVEVREPVPSNLDEIAGKVAASFHIGEDKALALLRRAPGAVTRAVSEREADVVARIFERAGLNVVKLPVEEPAEAAAGASGAPAEPFEGEAGEPVADAAVSAETAPPEATGEVATGGEAAGEEAVAAEGAAAVEGAEAPAEGAAIWEAELEEPAEAEADEGAVEADAGVWEQPLEETASGTAEEFSSRTGFEDATDALPLGADAEQAAAATEGALDVDDGALGAVEVPMVGRASQTPETFRRSQTPETVRRSQTPETVRRSQTPETLRRSQTPEMVRRSQTPEMLRSTLTRDPDEIKLQGGLRRRLMNAAILPALLTWVVMVVAVIVTLMPVLRSQQLGRATNAAQAEATTLATLTGGMPLTAQTLQAPLADLARRSQAALGGGVVTTMVVTDATGVPVAAWHGSAGSAGSLPADVRRAVSNRALDAVAGKARAGESFGSGLRATWHDVLAMLGLGSAADLYGAAPVMGAGQAQGAVVVGVASVGGGSLAGNGFLTALLVGLVPVLVAILVAMGLTRGLRGQVSYLLAAADRVSRGDLDDPVELESRDEFALLARAIERMRVSLKEGMERLRLRR